LPNLANSIVILDEVQTIPYIYWELIKKTFEKLGQSYNCFFILMSATQPLIFAPGREIVEIVPDYKKYFLHFNRTRLINRSSIPTSITDFLGNIRSYSLENPTKDILLILNTKRHSKQCFETLRETIDPESEEIYYLSTLITPYERKKIIDRIGQKSTKRRTIVSTQLIEAGVDISVDTVFRSLAPIDAIIQAAGRANRYAEKSTPGEVYVYEIEDMKLATSCIYGSDLIQMTKNVLKNVNILEESSYLCLIEAYFTEIQKQSNDYHSKYLDGIYSLNFSDVGQFSLIEEMNTESVFIQLNEKAKAVWDSYIRIWVESSLDLYEKKEAFAKIKSNFYDFVINVPVAYNKKSIDFDSEPVGGFYLSSLESPSRFYNYDPDDSAANTGYQAITTLIF